MIGSVRCSLAAKCSAQGALASFSPTRRDKGSFRCRVSPHARIVMGRIGYPNQEERLVIKAFFWAG